LEDVKGIADLIEDGFIKPQQERYTLLVNNTHIALNAFTKEFIVNIQLAMAHGLKGVDKIKTMKIFLKKEEEAACHWWGFPPFPEITTPAFGGLVMTTRKEDQTACFSGESSYIH
jgi:hypothetical protein